MNKLLKAATYLLGLLFTAALFIFAVAVIFLTLDLKDPSKLPLWNVLSTLIPVAAWHFWLWPIVKGRSLRLK